MRIFTVIFFIILLHCLAFAEKLTFYTNKKSSKIDLNNDGKIDVETLFEKNQLIKSIYTPSWHKRRKEIVKKLNKNVHEYTLWVNNKIIQKKIIKAPIDTKDETIVEIFENFHNNNWQSKTVVKHNFYLRQKISETYKFIKGNWNRVSIKVEKLNILTQFSANKCIGSAKNGLKKVNDFKNEYDYLFPNEFRYYPTQLGYRIDYNSCPPAAIEQFNEAIQIIIDQKLTCLKDLNPDLAHAFIRNLAFQENIIYCSTSTKVKDNEIESGAYGYTHFSPDAEINMLHLDNTTGKFNRSIEGLASTLFHETLHHHLPSCENHNHGDPSDGVMGCEFMCSGYANNDVHAIPLDFLSKASLEGCQQCVSSELKNTCSQMPYLMEIDKCTKKEESQDNKYYECASKTAAKYHPKRDECLAKTKDTYICGKIYGIEIWTHPKFDTCMSIVF